jgi:hypothetical protein
MTNKDGQEPDRALKERIAILMRAHNSAPKKPISGGELANLKAAARRLDRRLQHAADAERKALQSAAGRLDRLLADIHSGKDIKIPKSK